MTTGGAWRTAVAVVAGAAIVRVLFAALIPLFPDEAYYWAWSRHLAAGYFDHPPGVALTVAFGDRLLSLVGFGGSPLAVRLGAVLAGLISALGTIALARRLAGDAAALRAAVIITVMPLAAAGLLLATPDAPVLAATAVTLYCVVRALEAPPHSREALEWWLLTGVATGLAFWSKYTSIFVPVGVVVGIVARRDLRARLTEPGPYLAVLVATIVFIPVLAWNARHDWISFTYQLQHGLATSNASALASVKRELEFIGGEAGLASPILFVMLVIAVGRALRRTASPVQFVLGIVATASFGFFVYSALEQRVEPNWPAPAFIPAIALLAATTWSARGKTWMNAGIGLAAALSLLVYVQGIVPILPVRPGRDPIARAFGWGDVAARASAAAEATARTTQRRTWLGGDRYQEASELAIQLPSHPETFAMNLSGRPNQYDLWPRFPDRAARGDNLVLVLDEGEKGAPHEVARLLMPFFGSAAPGDLVALKRREGQIGVRRIWVFSDWNGGWPRSVAGTPTIRR